MPKYTQDIILTGATGIVGSHILYELLGQHLCGSRTGELVLLVRTSARQSVTERVRAVLSSERLPSLLSDTHVDDLMALLTVVPYDLSASTIAGLPLGTATYHLVHCAATTNLGTDPAAATENKQVNYDGSITLFAALAGRLHKLSYISTVYACGIRTGVIADEYSELSDLQHRNPYEQIKLQTEYELRRRSAEASVDYQVLRPAVVVGRLLDTPHYYLPRYNVIYAYAAFFQKLSRRGVDQHFPIPMHPDSTLHLVPVDYVAKAIVRALDTTILELNIVPATGCPVAQSIETMLSIVGYSAYTFVRELQPTADRLLRAYEARVVSSFGRYIQDAPYTFDNTTLLALMEDTPMPSVEAHFAALMQYAADRDFKASS